MTSNLDWRHAVYGAGRLILLGGLTLTTGCGSLAVGEKRFGCQGHPSDPLCLPASQVYQLTSGTDTLQPRDPADVLDADAQRPPRHAATRERSDSIGSMGFFGEDAALFGPSRAKTSRPRAAQTPADVVPVEKASHAVAESLLLPRSRDPIPLRLPSQVMRIWLAPWEDDQSDLHASGYVFTEIVPRTWTLAAGPDRFSNAQLKPLQVQQRTHPVSQSPGQRRAPAKAEASSSASPTMNTQRTITP